MAVSGMSVEMPKALKFEPVFPELTFEIPVAFLVDLADNKIAYVAGNKGKVWRVDFSSGAKSKEVILDISGRMPVKGGDFGLFDMIFHPDYTKNKKVIITYTNENPKEDRVSSFTITEKGIDPESEKIHLKLERPHESGNIGHLAFGPDGYLYVGVADGGQYEDTKNNAQNVSNLFGSILRIDLGNLEENYKIPTDNPFVNVQGARGEIWAYGFRVPWRFSFDQKTGVLYCADVGQSKREEINIVLKGKNYGWPVKEGTVDFQGPGKEGEDYVKPIAEYGRDVGLAVIGGYVYRGNIPELQGVYMYCDFLTDNFWGLRYDEGKVTELKLLGNYSFNVTSFSQDAAGEIYVCSFRNKNIYKLSGIE
jgi:glucose/arabinose dehydrogenase